MRRGGSEDLRSLMRGVFRERAQEPRLTLNRLRQNWPQVVGAELAAQTQPRRLDGGTLWIAATDACWAYELQFFKAELLNSVQTYLDTRTIHDLRFQAALPDAPGVAGPLPASPVGDGAAAAEPPQAVTSQTEPPLAVSPQAVSPQTVPPLAVSPQLAPPPALARSAGAIGNAELRAVFERTLAKQRRARQSERDATPQAPGARNPSREEP